MSITCKSCGKFIMSVFKDICDDCERRERERAERNERTRQEGLREDWRRRLMSQQTDNDLMAFAMMGGASQDPAPICGNKHSHVTQYETIADTCKSSYTPTETYTPPTSSYYSSSYSSSSCGDSGGGGGGGGGD